MKAIAIVVTLLTIGASTEDLKYEAAVREAFTAFEKQVETIRTETGTTSPDRLVPVLMARRSLWESEGGEFFERLNNGFYVQKMGTGEAKLYSLADKRPEYVELALVEGGWLMRLYEDHMDVKAPGKEFKRHQFKGKWVR